MSRDEARDRWFAARILDVADGLFTEYPDLPVMSVIAALNQARRDLGDCEGQPPSPDVLAAVVRERLNGRDARVAATA